MVPVSRHIKNAFAVELQQGTRLWFFKLVLVQVLNARWRLWVATTRLTWAQQLLRVRSMSWATPLETAIDRLCGTS